MGEDVGTRSLRPRSHGFGEGAHTIMILDARRALHAGRDIDDIGVQHGDRRPDVVRGEAAREHEPGARSHDGPKLPDTGRHRAPWQRRAGATELPRHVRIEQEGVRGSPQAAAPAGRRPPSQRTTAHTSRDGCMARSAPRKAATSRRRRAAVHLGNVDGNGGGISSGMPDRDGAFAATLRDIRSEHAHSARRVRTRECAKSAAASAWVRWRGPSANTHPTYPAPNSAATTTSLGARHAAELDLRHAGSVTGPRAGGQDRFLPCSGGSSLGTTSGLTATSPTI